MKALFLGVCFLALAGCSVASDAAVLLRGVSTEFKSSKISELQVGDLTTHLLHTTPLHVSADRTDFPEVSLGVRPKALLFTMIESLAMSDIAGRSDLRYFNSQEAQQIEIEMVNNDEDPIVTATTIVSGEDKAGHGIYGSAWKDQKTNLEVAAYETFGHAEVWRIPDAVAQSSNGKALTFSASSSLALAGALGLHSDLSAQNSEWNYEGIYWHSGLSSFRYQGGGAHALKIQAVREYADRLCIPSQRELYDLRFGSSADTHFFAELALLDYLSTELHDQLGQADGSSDFISFGVAGIQELKRKYGEESDQVQNAISLLDKQMALTHSALKALAAPAGLISETVLLGSSTEVWDVEHHLHRREGDDGADDDENEYTYADVANYQVVFWASFLIFVGMLWASCFMLCMETGTDTLLFRGLGGKAAIQ